jgi:hypothetical protein
MLQQPATTYFLHVYDVESGLWARTMLGSEVSPRSVEAMNLILSKDGITAFIGTRSEFGVYSSKLKRDQGKDSRCCWTSLPASTIMSMLGLCLNIPESGRPEVVFNGSPVVLTVQYLLLMRDDDLESTALLQIERDLENSGIFTLDIPVLERMSAISPRHVCKHDVEEALTYLSVD